MRAPLPSLQRLFALAAVPAQCGQHWRALDPVMAGLDRPRDSAAAASAARIDALLGAPPLGERLVPALARLLVAVEAGGGVDVVDAPALRAARPSEPAQRPSWPATAVPTSADEAIARRLASQPTALPNRPQGLASQAAANPQPARRGWPSSLRTGPAPSRLVETQAALPSPAAARLPESLARALTRPQLSAGQARADQQVDAATALAIWQTRLQASGLAAAWRQAMNPPQVLMAATTQNTLPGSVPPVQDAGAAAPAWFDASQPTGLENRPARTLDDLAPRPGAAAAAGLAPDTPAQRRVVADALVPPQRRAGLDAAGQPLALQSGASIGGFKGLAALGRALAPAAQVTPVTNTTPPALPAAAAAEQEAPLLDPRSLMDQIESALREQAARNGITLGGLEP